MTATQRKAALLGEADLPAEWRELPPGAERGALPVGDPVCQPLASLLGDMLWGPDADVGKRFRHGAGEAHVSTRVVAYPGSAARDHVARLSGALDGCPSFTTSLQGLTMNVRASRLLMPRFGTDSETFRLSAGREGGPLNVQSDVVVLRRGAEVLSFQYSPTDPSDHEDFDPLARLAKDKFVKATRD
ncbi:hypothetical protein ACIPQJ_33865 [Streptomyces sp. NPDC090082]|uniref:hypothetical protein n=1 Tax=unclassified Streptomyces TaxID=2593676 RepID=UPI0038067044